MRGERVALLVLLLAASGAAAQAGGTSETMELTDRAPPTASAPGGSVCSNLQLYGVAEPGGAPAQQTKAYTSRSSALVGCPTLFRGPVPGAFNLTGEVGVHLFIGCEEPTVMHQPLNNLRVWLTRNGAAVGESLTTIGPVCSPGTPMEAEVAIEVPEDPSFDASDAIGLNVTPFGSPNAAVDNLHVLVGGNESASTLTVPGLSSAYAVDEAEQTVNATENETDAFANGSQLEEQSTDDGGNGVPGVGVAGTVAVLAGLALARRVGR